MRRVENFRFLIIALAFLVFSSVGARGAESLNWSTNENRVSADIESVPLMRLLEGVAQATGWQVYVESNVTADVSVKFKDLPTGEALRFLLGKLNFALVPQTNASPRFYVFQSSQENATTLIHPADLNPEKAKPIPNELVITLKKGAKIENLDCIQTGKVAGKIASLNAYLVKFENEAAARAARDCLTGNPDVDSIDSNFSVDRTPPPTQPLDANVAPDFNLKVNQSSGNCPVIIGLVDTGGTVPPSLKNLVRPSMSVFNGSHSPAPGDLTHGTAMLETIAEVIQNSSQGSTSVQIQPMDVYGGNPTTTTFDVAQGIYKVITEGHANVVNLSLGSPGDSVVLHNLIRQASEQGIVFFGAAGNEPVTTPMYPAAYPEVFAVTAGDHNGQVSNYANRGNFVDMMAPGTSVVPFEGQSYIVTGTSTATAYVSGLVAGLADSGGNCPSEVVPAVRAKLGVRFQ
jgi:hypothetical protein